MGNYHGEEGFRELSHGKAVFSEHRWFPIELFHPPYGNFVQRLVLRLFIGAHAADHMARGWRPGECQRVMYGARQVWYVGALIRVSGWGRSAIAQSFCSR